MTTPPVSRDPYLDHLRGGFHVIMLVDHLPILLPGMLPLIAWVFECAGFISVAEGFVFLSGYVTGLVYTRVRRQQGEAAVWRKAVGRALVIHLTFLAAILLVLLLVRFGGSADISWAEWGPLINQPIGRALIQAASLQVQPTFLEILPMYSVFLLATPLLIRGFEAQKSGFIVLASLSLWATELFGWPSGLLPCWPTFEFFNWFGWQILFVGGLVCGHKSLSQGRWLPRSRTLPLLAYGVAVACFALHHDVFEWQVNLFWVQRSSLGPLRLLNFGCVVFLLAIFRTQIAPLIGWRALSLLSRQSLPVFAFHLLPIYAAALLITERSALSLGTQPLFVVLCIAGLFAIAWIAQGIKARIANARRCVASISINAPQV